MKRFEYPIVYYVASKAKVRSLLNAGNLYKNLAALDSVVQYVPCCSSRRPSSVSLFV